MTVDQYEYTVLIPASELLVSYQCYMASAVVNLKTEEAEEKKKKKNTNKQKIKNKTPTTTNKRPKLQQQQQQRRRRRGGGGGEGKPEKKQRKKKRKTRGSQSRLASSLKTTSTGTGFGAVPPPPPRPSITLPSCHLCQHQRRRFQPTRPDTGTLQYTTADSVSLQRDPSTQVHRQETADCWQLTLQRGSLDRHNDATGRRSQMTQCLDPHGRQTDPTVTDHITDPKG